MEQLKRAVSEWIPFICARKLASISILLVLSLNGAAQQDLTFSTTAGDKVSLSSLRGKVVMLVFSSVQDPQCRDEFKALEFLSARYHDRDVAIYWVSIDPSVAIRGEKLTGACGPAGSVPILDDPEQTGFRKFGTKILRLPTLVILDKEGRISGKPLGGFNPDPDFVDSLGATIDGLLSAK